MGPNIQSQLSEFCLGWMNVLAPHENIPPGALLYHYTSAAKMRNILSSQQLRAHHILKQSDYTEVLYAATLLRARIEHRYAYAQEKHSRDVLHALRTAMTEISADDVFVLSFSISGERAPMWRLYGDEGRGFSFCIDIPSTQMWPGLIILTACNYDPIKQAEFLDASLDLIVSLYHADVTAGNADDPANYAALFFNHVAWFATMFKPKEYTHEKEWRIVFRRPASDQKNNEAGRKYIEAPGPAYGRLPIKAISAGPACDLKGEIKPMAAHARSCGYGDIPFYKNERPVAE